MMKSASRKLKNKFIYFNWNKRYNLQLYFDNCLIFILEIFIKNWNFNSILLLIIIILIFFKLLQYSKFSSVKLFFVGRLLSHFIRVISMLFMKFKFIVVIKIFNFYFILIANLNSYFNFATDIFIQKHFYLYVIQYFSKLIMPCLINYSKFWIKFHDLLKAKAYYSYLQF